MDEEEQKLKPLMGSHFCSHIIDTEYFITLVLMRL